MCTLIALWRVHAAAPLVLALNRDELLARETEPVHLWPDMPVVAGRDRKAGGTWFAVGRKVVAGLTNHRAGMRSPPGGRSRGELVTLAARADSLEEVRERLGELPMEAYGGFHLLVADATHMGCFTNRDGVLAETSVEPGVHVLGNYGIDDREDPVVAAVRPHVEEAAGRAESELDLVEALKSTLQRHGPGWPCVHMGAYGTQSSALLLWRGGYPLLEVTDGPSCEAPWRDRSELLRRLSED
jgi:uncharacterized protein with NRDE domain